jgi:tetratricopeptide (TPR) repeat protein
MRRPAAIATAALLMLATAACQHDLTGPATGTAPAAGVGQPGPAAPSNREQAEAHYLLAQAMEAAGETAEAVAGYEAALSLDHWRTPAGADPVADTPYAGLARLCEGGGPPEPVVRACGAVATSPRFSFAQLALFQVRRAEAHLRLGETARAMADLDAAEKLDSGTPGVLLVRGRALEASGDNAAALRSYTRALFGQPGWAEAHLARGRLRARLGDETGAEADFDAVLSDPQDIAAHPDAYRDRAMLHCRQGNWEAASVGWQVWAGLVPGGPAYLSELLEARGYLRNPAPLGLGPGAQAALAAWTREGCPEG